MANRNRYHITKTNEGWKGAKENSKRASVTGKTKEEVQQKTIDMAKGQGNSSVVIHGRDGKNRKNALTLKVVTHIRQKGDFIFLRSNIGNLYIPLLSRL